MIVPRSQSQLTTRDSPMWGWLLGSSFALMLSVVLATLIGPQRVTLGDYCSAWTSFDEQNNAHLAVREIRLPRAMIAIMVGGSLASAGALMQGVTGNPLAGPSIMGLTSGASLTLLLGLLFTPNINDNIATALTFVGALLGYAAVYVISFASRGSPTPVRIALAGMVVSGLLQSLTQALMIAYGMHDEMLYWTAGGIAGVGWRQVGILLPVFVVGMTGAVLVAPSVNVLNLGEEVAVGLGQRTRLTRTAATFCVLLLTAGATAVAGPIGFVGLLTPHAVRHLVGHDYQRITIIAALLGACVTLLADGAGRLVGGDQELPMGLLVTMIGAPAFVWIARRHSHRNSGA